MTREQQLKQCEREFIQEITMQHPDWVKDRRIEYLTNRKQEIFHEILDHFELHMQYGWHTKIKPQMFYKFFSELKRIKVELDMYQHPRYTGTNMQEMIETARNFPIDQLIEVNAHGFAKCPFHNDKNPSAFTRNNYLYCFSCNTHADSIKLYMHLHNVTFKEAVKCLNK